MVPKVTKRTVKSMQTQQKIMEAAKLLMWQYGYEGMSIQQVCQEAQVSIGTFYHFFQSKHDLLMRIASRLMAVNNRWNNFDYENDSPYKLAEYYSKRVIDLMEVLTPEALFNIYFPDSGGNKLFFSKEHPTHEYLNTALAGFQKAGKLRTDISVEQMYRELLSCHFGMFYTNYTTDTLDTCQQDLEAILKRLIGTYMVPGQA